MTIASTAASGNPSSGVFAFFTDRKISTKISAGFVLVLALLVAVAATGYFGLTGARSIFEGYAVVSENSARVLSVDRDFTGLRRNAFVYAEKGSDAALKRVRELAGPIKSGLGAAAAATTSAERKETLQRASGSFDKYMTNFDLIVQKRAERDRAVNEVMNPLGAKMRIELTEIMQGAIKDNFMDTAAYAGVAQESLMLARLNANRFLLSGDQKLVATAEEQLAAPPRR